MTSALLVLCGSLILATSAWAQARPDEVSDLRRQVRQLTESVRQLTSTVQSQQQRMDELERANAQLQQAQANPSVVQAPAPSVSTPTVGAFGGPVRLPQAASSLSAFNPEIGALADVVGRLSESSADGEGNDTVSARELELVFGHPIDPYSRLDVTTSFSDVEAASLEEAYVTHWGLPAELKARVGRFRPPVSKASALHRDSLDTVDEPLFVEQYLGAEGLSRTGVELSGFLPLPWDAVVHHLAAGILEGGVGEGGTLFGSVRRRPSYYAHLKNFWDITDTTNTELGVTYFTGSRDDDSDLEVDALGFDATFVHYFTPTNKLKWQNEAYLQERDEAVGIAVDGTETLFRDTPWGFYTLLDYRLSPRLGVGGRVDYVEPVDVDPVTVVRAGDTAWGGYLTFYQSEFARWRLQFRHTNFARGGDDNTVFLQGTVAIGVHTHQLQ